MSPLIKKTVEEVKPASEMMGGEVEIPIAKMDYEQIKTKMISIGEVMQSALNAKDTGTNRKKIRKLTLEHAVAAKHYRKLSVDI
jgi:hypothetical protein